MRSKLHCNTNQHGHNLQFLGHEGCTDGGRAVGGECLLDISDDERGLSDAYSIDRFTNRVQS